jgi:MFS family permease
LSAAPAFGMLEEMESTPPAERRFRPVDYLKITVLGFALAAVANGMHAIILPLRIQELVGEGQKSTYLGVVTFTGLVVAILVQPIAGAISDRSGFSWGRRKPFILAGILATLVMLMGLGAAGSFAAIFILWGLAQMSMNTAQGPFQAFILDLAPESKRGLASGVKNLLEIAGGVALLRVIGQFMGHYSRSNGSGWLWLSIGVLGLVLLITLAITLLTVKEKTGSGGLDLPWSRIFYQAFRIDVKANSGFILFLVSRLLFIMALTTLQTFSLYYFQDVVKISNPAEVTADLVTAVGIAMLVIVYPAGRYSDKIGRKPILMASGGLAAVGVLLIFFYHALSLILFAGSLIGLAAGAFLSTNWALATDLVPKEEAARYLGLTNLASAGGGALARLIGPLIDLFNRRGEGMGYTLMLGACFLYFITGAILIWRIKVPDSSY